MAAQVREELAKDRGEKRSKRPDMASCVTVSWKQMMVTLSIIPPFCSTKKLGHQSRDQLGGEMIDCWDTLGLRMLQE